MNICHEVKRAESAYTEWQIECQHVDCPYYRDGECLDEKYPNCFKLRERQRIPLEVIYDWI